VLADLCESLDATDNHNDPSRGYEKFHALLKDCCQGALNLSDMLSRRYFSHADSGSQSLGA
jgi:hypothetical protein